MSGLSVTKEQALGNILREMEAHHLAPSDIAKAHQQRQKSAAKAESKESSSAARHQTVLRLFYYLGSTLIFVGLGFICTRSGAA